MKDSIKISPKHGVNPSVTVCFFCGEAMGVALFGALKGDAEAPSSCVLDMEPCEKCREWMKQGIILISADRSRGDEKNPYRTGGWAVVKEEAVKMLITSEELLARVLVSRCCFIDDEDWDRVGLPRRKTEEAHEEG